MIKKLLFICFGLFISTYLHAQSSNWIKGHAVWNYEWFYPVATGSLRIETMNDTLIQGRLCQKLKCDRHEINWINQSGELANYVVTSYKYISFSQDTVWFLDDDNQFKVLYDFTVTQGQVRLLATNGLGNGVCNDSSYLLVDSVYNGTLNGVNTTFYQMRDSSTNSIHHGGLVNSHFGMMDNGFSPSHQFFQGPAWCMFVPDDGTMYQLRCFQDDSLTYNPGNVDCEYYTYLGITESQKTHVSVFPNPSRGKVELLSDVLLKKIRLTNVVGAVLKEIPTNLASLTIDLSEFPSGTYYLDLEDVNGNHLVKPIQLAGTH